MRDLQHHALSDFGERPVPHTPAWAEAMRQSGERGWALYRKMGSPRKIVAPMVDQSELAFRMLARKYGAELCYTPMINSKILLEDHTYRSTNLDLECPEDRPLIVQFCGNDPGVMAAAAQLVDRRCDAVDINLGCPQNIARRGRYGAFLLEEWDLLQNMVWAMHCSAKVPVTCKVRLLQESVEDTIELCKLLVGAGAAMLTVHGRTRSQVGCLAGVCDWDAIRRIREAVPVPVFANGGIGCIEDFEECLRVTGAAGVMVSEVVLSNPAFFAPNAPGPCGVAPTSESMCREYLALARRFPPKRYVSGILRGHVFKLLFTALSRCEDLRPVLAVSHSLEDVERACEIILERNRGLMEADSPFAWYFRHRKHLTPGGDPTPPPPGPDTTNPALRNRKKPMEPAVHDSEAMAGMFHDDSADY